MTKVIARVHPVHLMNVDWAPAGRQPPDQASRLGCETAENWQLSATSTLAIVIITQPVGWYSFYRPTKGGRLSRPKHCSKGAQPVPKTVYRSSCHDKHNCQRRDSNLDPLTPQSDALIPLGHWDLPNSHDKTVLSVSCLVCRCELDDCSERVQASHFLSATVLSCRESSSHHRSRHDTDKTVLSCRVWRFELAFTRRVHWSRASASRPDWLQRN